MPSLSPVSPTPKNMDSSPSRVLPHLYTTKNFLNDPRIQLKATVLIMCLQSTQPKAKLTLALILNPAITQCDFQFSLFLFLTRHHGKNVVMAT